MRWFTTALLVLAGVLSCAPIARTESRTMDEVVIFYFPFDEDTYVPITMESIEEKAICKLILPRSSSEALLIQRAIEASNAGRFDNTAVRLKTVGLLEDAIYIDVDGGVVRERSRKEGRMTQEHFNEVKAVLARLAKQQGCE